MSIIYLQNKQKSKYTLNLIPERTWASSSSGISGSVYVFPNRSHLQKDNIDERLELAAYLNDDGVSTTIRPYTDNSLDKSSEDSNFFPIIWGPKTSEIL